MQDAVPINTAAVRSVTDAFCLMQKVRAPFMSAREDIVKVRVKFSKVGPLKFIGHLDMMRYFQKAIRRSGIAICYSTGFSPHQIMSFAAPLGVGVESLGEYFDIEVSQVSTSEEMIAALNAEMAEGVVIEGMCLLPDNAQNAMASVQAASYEVHFDGADEADASLPEWIACLLNAESYIYTKEGKKGKGPIEKDIRPAIFDLKLLDNKTLYMLVDASSASNLKPGAVVEALYGYGGDSAALPSFRVLRLDTFTRDEVGCLIPLGDVGNSF